MISCRFSLKPIHWMYMYQYMPPMDPYGNLTYPWQLWNIGIGVWIQAVSGRSTPISEDPKGRNDQKNFSTKSHFSAEPKQFQNQQHVSKTSIAFHHLRSISRCFQRWNKKIKKHLIPCPTRCPNSFFAKPMPAVMNSLSRDSWSKTPRKCPKINDDYMIWWDFQRIQWMWMGF